MSSVENHADPHVSFAITETVSHILETSKRIAFVQTNPQIAFSKAGIAVSTRQVLLAIAREPGSSLEMLFSELDAHLDLPRSYLHLPLGFKTNNFEEAIEDAVIPPDVAFDAEVVQALSNALSLGEPTVTSCLLLYGISLVPDYDTRELLKQLNLSPEKIRGFLTTNPHLTKATGGIGANYDVYYRGEHGHMATSPVLPVPPTVASATVLNEDDVYIQDNEAPAIGVTDIAGEMCNLIRNLRTSDRGKMVGVFGAWGRGKTFLIDLIRKQLSQGNQAESNAGHAFFQVPFNAWKYQDTPASWAYLYEAFANAYFADETGRTGRAAIWQRAKKIFRLNTRRNGYYTLLRAVLGTALLGLLGWYGADYLHVARDKDGTNYLVLAAGALFPVSIALLTFARNALDASYNSALSLFNKYYRKNSLEHLLGVQAEVQKELQHLFHVWLDDQPNVKVLLIVDDIDRCNEQKIIQIIDALRVMLEEPDISAHVVVLAAIDERILKNAVKCKYQDLLKGLPPVSPSEEEYRIVSEYLDKLFISGVRLGPLTAREMCEVFEVYSKGHLEPDLQKAGRLLAKETLSPEEDTVTDEVVLKAEQSPAVNKYEQAVTPEASPAAAQRHESATPAPKSNYALSLTEAKNIKELLIQQNAPMTPRQIRVYYYRYLLARNMLLKRLRVSKLSTDKQTVKHALMWVLLHHFFQDNTVFITSKMSVYHLSEGSFLLTPQSPLLARIERATLLEIYAVAELVTGY